MTLLVAGRINYDVVIRVDGSIEKGKKYVGSIAVEGFGGTGTNIAIAVARAGGRVFIFGAIGEDLADKALRFFNSENVDSRFLVKVPGVSGRAYILVDSSGEPIIVTIPGANQLLKPEHVPRDMSIFRGVILGNIPYEVAKEITARANSSHVVFMDPGIAWNPLELARDVKGECFTLPNEYEYLWYLSKIDPYEDRKCIEVVKMGSRGAEAKIHNKKKIIRVSSFPIEKLGLEIVSKSGCGDVFTGVFAAIYLESRSIEKALLYATIAAGLKIVKPLSYDAPRRAELDNIAEKYSSYVSIDEEEM
ncbi:MAG: hypothetical protein JHC33_03020 [Ignisphaera sp.]|nr:hypothetical protein [Ignisphaera sp.]